jgi:hypothetical protein
MSAQGKIQYLNEFFNFYVSVKPNASAAQASGKKIIKLLKWLQNKSSHCSNNANRSSSEVQEIPHYHNLPILQNHHQNDHQKEGCIRGFVLLLPHLLPQKQLSVSSN